MTRYHQEVKLKYKDKFGEEESLAMLKYQNYNTEKSVRDFRHFKRTKRSEWPKKDVLIFGLLYKELQKKKKHKEFHRYAEVRGCYFSFDELFTHVNLP